MARYNLERLVGLLLVLGFMAPSLVAQQSLHASTLQGRQSTTRELMALIYKQGDKVPVRIFERLGEKKSEEALEAFRKAAKLLAKDDKLKALFVSVRHFAGVPELEPDAIDFLVESAASRNESERIAAAQGLVYFGLPAVEKIETLARSSRDERVRRFAVGSMIRYLQNNPSKSRLELLMDVYRIPGSGSRTLLIECLSAYADPVSLAIQGQRMKQPRFPRDMKLAIVEATARHAQRQHEARKGSIDEDVIGLLRTALKSKDELVQLAALQALEATNTGGHLRDLEKLAGTRDPSLRRAVFAALTKHHKTEEHWLKKMLSYANSPDVDKRCAAVQPLSQILGARAIEALTGMVSDKHHRVRRLLFPVLTLLRDPASVAPLIAQLEQEESRLRGSLRRTLMRITGEDHGSSFQRWSAWYASQSKPYVPPSLKTVVELERKRAHRRGAQVTEASFYGIEVESDRAAWVLDISGSMAAETRDGSTRLEEMKHQVGAALEALADGDLFNLVLFSGGVSSWQDELIPMSRRARREATDFLREIQARGATAIFDALEAAIEDPRLDTVYLLSDGDATAGTLVDPASVRAAVREWARRRSLTIHCIAVGADHPLLRGLAEDTGGQYRRVD